MCCSIIICYYIAKYTYNAKQIIVVSLGIRAAYFMVIPNLYDDFEQLNIYLGHRLNGKIALLQQSDLGLQCLIRDGLSDILWGKRQVVCTR